MSESRELLEARVRSAEADVARLRSILHEYIQQREAAESALAESEARYRALIARAAYGIYRASTGGAGRFVEVNPALVAMLGYDSAEELCAVDLARAIYADPAERARVLGAMAVAEPPDWMVAHWKRRDGSPVVVRLSARPVRDAQGRLVECEGIVEDVTARVRQEELLRRSERMASLGTLLAGVAHEINNPLAAVAGFAQLLMRAPLSPEDRLAAETISHEAARAGKIVRDLLTFARQEERSRREPVRLNDVVRHVVGAQRYAMETRGLRCTVTLDTTSPSVLGDAAQLEQVVLNLVVNARQAIEEQLDTPGGELAGTHAPLPVIEIATRVDGSDVLLAVRDTGPGIAAADLPHIFDPFFTTKSEGHGTGLGLSVVHGIVSEYGGTIEVDSSPGGGTTFLVRLPLVDGVADEAPVPVDEGQAATPLDVLLVDDEESVLGFLTRYLASRGHAVFPTRSAADALRLAGESTFDVLICDLRMPGIDGIELVRRLRALPNGMHTRAVIATAEAPTSTLRERASTLGVAAILEKPYDVEALRRAVERAMAVPRG